IGNEEYATRTCNLAQARPVIVRWYDAVRARVGLHNNCSNRLRTLAIDFISNSPDRTLSALDFTAAPERTAISVRRCHVCGVVTLRINLMARAGVSGESHAGIARTVIRTIACDDPALGKLARLPRELDRVLVGVGAARCKKYPTTLEARFLQ